MQGTYIFRFSEWFCYLAPIESRATSCDSDYMSSHSDTTNTDDDVPTSEQNNM